MKIKHYIVTYNNNEILNQTLQSLNDVLLTYPFEEYEVHIINNHTNFTIDSKFEGRIKVMHNQVRPDFSTGHLSRNWNQAIINGFENLNFPSCDLVITTQNDCVFQGNFVPQLLELHKKYSFVQFGTGDQFISYKPDAILNVGLWDERMCNIGYQEADYFLRQLLYNTEYCTINDQNHRRIHNPVSDFVLYHSPTGHDRHEPSHIESKKYHYISHGVYVHKWGISPMILDSTPGYWSYETMNNLTPKIPSYIYYPYFEKDVKSLEKQNYILI